MIKLCFIIGLAVGFFLGLEYGVDKIDSWLRGLTYYQWVHLVGAIGLAVITGIFVDLRKVVKGI